MDGINRSKFTEKISKNHEYQYQCRQVFLTGTFLQNTGTFLLPLLPFPQNDKLLKLFMDFASVCFRPHTFSNGSWLAKAHPFP